MPDIATLTFHTFDRGKPVAHDIRTLRVEGVRWFVGVDLCRALDLHVRATGEPNTTMALRHLNADEKRVERLELSPGVVPRTFLVTDAGFYKLIHKSLQGASGTPRRWAKLHLYPALSAALEAEPVPTTIPAALRDRAARLLALADEYEAARGAQAA